MTNASPQADRYLNDLARMLEGLDASERADVLQSVREHIDGAVADLGHQPSETEMNEILANLGDPAEVAADALAEQTPSQPPRRTGLDLTAAWVPPAATLSIFAGSLFWWVYFVPGLLLIAGIVAVIASPLWKTKHKLAACLFAPLFLLPAPLSGLILFGASGTESGPNAFAVIVPLVVVAALALLIWVWVVGARESARRHGE